MMIPLHRSLLAYSFNVITNVSGLRLNCQKVTSRGVLQTHCRITSFRPRKEKERFYWGKRKQRRVITYLVEEFDLCHSVIILQSVRGNIFVFRCYT